MPQKCPCSGEDEDSGEDERIVVGKIGNTTVSIEIDDQYDAYKHLNVFYGDKRAGLAEFDACEFSGLQVFKQYRMLGIGNLVVQFVFGLMAKEGCTVVTGLAVPESIGFLRKAGFTIGKRSGDFFEVSAKLVEEKACKQAVEKKREDRGEFIKFMRKAGLSDEEIEAFWHRREK